MRFLSKITFLHIFSDTLYNYIIQLKYIIKYIYIYCVMSNLHVINKLWSKRYNICRSITQKTILKSTQLKDDSNAALDAIHSVW